MKLGSCVAIGAALLTFVACGDDDRQAERPDGTVQQQPAGRTASSTTSAPGSHTQASPEGDGQPAQASNPGLREVDVSKLTTTFYSLTTPDDMLASALLGLDVHNHQDEEIGTIRDVIIDDGKTLRAVVISVGGYLGLGDRDVAIEPGSLLITRDEDGDLKAVVNTNRDDLKNAPEFEPRNKLITQIDDLQSSAAGPLSQGIGRPTHVFFGFDRADLTSEAREILDRLAERARREGITIAGHADTAGPGPYNQRLSQRRARAVKSYLMEKGVPEAQIHTEAFGETRPLVETGDGVREPQNRRAAIEIREPELGATPSGASERRREIRPDSTPRNGPNASLTTPDRKVI